MAFAAAEESLAVNVANPPLDQGKSIRAFIESVPAALASPFDERVGCQAPLVDKGGQKSDLFKQYALR
jgi:hypothetical protein